VRDACSRLEATLRGSVATATAHDSARLGDVHAQLAKVIAERNALERIALNLQREIDALRHSPCETCAERIREAEERGALWAILAEETDSESGMELHRAYAARICAEARTKGGE
jgi:hypothetical protein